MKIVCIGDSLTEGDYGVPGKTGIANVHSENYPYFLQQLTGDEVVNAGRCGFDSCRYLTYFLSGAVPVADADLILVLLGTNGRMDPDLDLPGNRDYETLIEKIQLAAPGARIVLCTPPHVTENPAYSNCGYADRVRRSVLFVRDFAARKGFLLIDTAAVPEFTAENEVRYQNNDGLHFIEEGYRHLAAFVASAISPYRTR